ncbi:hypothetical protein [Flavobacterium aquiphilum]|uniref:hypothetical protein n=1 Tax=Flavobacterium aquiphilum TaxID=3003261 RepID=UPI0024807CCB|nr:hypothetical protein [Flavobacterium aquiphilum]
MKIIIPFFAIGLFMISSAAKAQIGIDKLNYNWSRIENDLPVVLGGNEVANGDANKDGAVLIKGNANIPTVQGVQYLLPGSPGNLKQINLEAKYYQYDLSYVKFKMQLFDVTDNIVLAETADFVAKIQGEVATASLSYVFKPSNKHDQIAVRFVREDDLNPVRILAIDCLKVNGKFVKIKK